MPENNVFKLSGRVKSITAALIMATLAGCGGGGSSSSTSNETPAENRSEITISGVVETVGSSDTFAQLDTSSSILIAGLEFFIPSTQAAILGLEPVSGALVELVHIDDDGVQVGDVLASTRTSFTGDYSLALPAGVSFAGNLIVRITGSTASGDDISMAALVVDESVDINPISQFALDKFIDEPNLVLADLDLSEVISIQGKAEQFDLSAGGDLKETLSQLETQLGDFIGSSVHIATATPDDGTAATSIIGKWNRAEFSMGLTDIDNDTLGTYILTSQLESDFSIAANDTGVKFIAGLKKLDLWSKSYGQEDIIINKASLDFDDENATAFIDSDGRIIVLDEFSEVLDSVSLGDPATDIDSDGPNYGWLREQWTSSFYPVTNDTYISVPTESRVRFATTDTDNDYVYDAIDPNARLGDEFELSLTLLLKQGLNMTEADVTGDFGMVSLLAGVNLDNYFESSVSKMNLSNGTVSIQASSENTRRIERVYAGNELYTLNVEQVDKPNISNSYPYTVTLTGDIFFDLNGDGSDMLKGFTNSNGAVLAFSGADLYSPNGFIVNAEHDFAVAVKLGHDMERALNGATYRLHALQTIIDDTGLTLIGKVKNSSIEFNSDASSAVLTSSMSGVFRTNERAQIQTVSADEEVDALTVTIDDNGALYMTEFKTEEKLYLKGFVSADTEMLVLRVYSELDDSSSSEMGRAIGIIIGEKQ